jgi:RNA polymerase primary sigma factor
VESYEKFQHIRALNVETFPLLNENNSKITTENPVHDDQKIWESNYHALFNSKISQTKNKFHENGKLQKTLRSKSCGDIAYHKTDHTSKILTTRKKKLINKPQIDEKITGLQGHQCKSGLEVLLSNKKLSQKGLLTAEEEKKYATLIQQLIKIHSYEHEAIKTRGTQLDTLELAKIFGTDAKNFVIFRSACEEARRRMMDCNIRLVISVAKKIHQNKRGMDIHDLVTVGIDGLTRAVEKFDPNKGYKFSTYAHWWIRQAVDRFVLEQRTIKVPTHLWEILSKIRKGQRALSEKLGRKPTDNEVGALLGLHPNRVASVVAAYQDTESLDMTFNNSGSNQGPLEEVLVFDSNELEGPDHLKALEFSETKVHNQIEALLKTTLSERQAEIIRMRYGLDDGVPKTLDEIGERFHVTRERVRQIETKVARKLKLSNLCEKLNGDLSGIIETSHKCCKAKAAGLRKSD